ncbi:MAG TPA: ThuA domain-containing protein [Planctomycetota bacterium]|nr:ThuA domain-containing protein [Planctomycetota bacterium]
MNKKALIVWGGWAGHDPENIAKLFERVLKEHGFSVSVSPALDAFNDAAGLKDLSLIVPIWTMGTISNEQCKNVCEAVSAGVGIGGVHGGMCDAFRSNTEWQFLTGGQFVAHPGNDGINYKVNFTGKHWITDGLVDYEVSSEQYYMHVDPANTVLATTKFPIAAGPHVPNGEVIMPLTWIKQYGKGRVFYCSLGHTAKVVEQPQTLKMCTRGLLWAARAESA